jgi:hypothetical protein
MALATTSFPTLLNMSGNQMVTGPSYIGGTTVQWAQVGDSTNEAWQSIYIPSSSSFGQAAGTSDTISKQTTPIEMENNNGTVPSSSAQSEGLQWDQVGDSTNNDKWQTSVTSSKFNFDEYFDAMYKATTPIEMENNNGTVPSSSAQSNDLQVAVIPNINQRDKNQRSNETSKNKSNSGNDAANNKLSTAPVIVPATLTAAAAAATTLAAAAYKTQQKEENQKEEKEKDEEEEKKQKEEEQKSKNPRFKATSTNKKLTKSVSNLVKDKIPQLLMFSGAATLSAIAMNQRYNFVQDRKQAVKNASKRRKERSKDIW